MFLLPVSAWRHGYSISWFIILHRFSIENKFPSLGETKDFLVQFNDVITRKFTEQHLDVKR